MLESQADEMYRPERIETMTYADAFVERLNLKFPDHKLEVVHGRKFDKIVHTLNDSFGTRWVFAFVDKSNGDLYKAASWKSRARGVRFTGDKLLTEAVEKADRYGKFLYR